MFSNTTEVVADNSNYDIYSKSSAYLEIMYVWYRYIFGIP